MASTAALLYSAHHGFGFGPRTVTIGEGFGVGPAAGCYGIVSFIQNRFGTTSLSQPPTVFWNSAPLSKLGGVYLNNDTSVGMVSVFGGYVATNGEGVKFTCASSTAFSGSVGTHVLSGIKTVGTLQTAAGADDHEFTVSGAGGLVWVTAAGWGTWFPSANAGCNINTVTGINFSAYAFNTGPISVPNSGPNPWAVAGLVMS